MLEMTRSVARASWVLVVGAALGGCGGAGQIDTSLNSPISNSDTFATIGYLWAGVRSAILAKREPSTDTFSLALAYGYSCVRGGQGSYQGTLAGTKSAGRGSAVLSVTGTLAACQFEEINALTTITASGLSASGPVAVVSDQWDAITIHLVATAVTVNGVVCPGGVDVTITATAPSAQPVSTGTACGRTGAVTLP